MTIDNKHNFADAEILTDHDSSLYPPVFYTEPTATPVTTTTTTTAHTTTHSTAPSVDAKTNNSPTDVPVFTPSVSSATASSGQYAEDEVVVVQHNAQHKRNVVSGAVCGVIIGLLFLGPIGAVAGGFGGAAIVRRRERRWCRKNGWQHVVVSVPATHNIKM